MKPLNLRDEEVRGLLDRTRRMLVRPVKPQPARDGGIGAYRTDGSAEVEWVLTRDREPIDAPSLICPFGSPGERLWVREAFAVVPESAYRRSTGIEQTINPIDPYSAAVYRVGFDRSRSFPWKPSSHMPRWASRLTLTAKSVRVVRVQEISEEEAASMLESHDDDGMTYYGPFDNGHASAACELKRQWSQHHGKSYPWDSNPWAWLGEMEGSR